MFTRNDEIKPFKSKVWLSSPTMHGEELEYMTKAYETNWMSTVGENIKRLNDWPASIRDVDTVCSFSGTAALHMAVKLAGVKPGDKVFCSDMTFDTTVNPVVYEGASRCLLTQSMIHGIWTRWLLKKL